MNNKIIDPTVEGSHAVYGFTVYFSHKCSNQNKTNDVIAFQKCIFNIFN